MRIKGRGNSQLLWPLTSLIPKELFTSVEVISAAEILGSSGSTGGLLMNSFLIRSY